MVWYASVSHSFFPAVFTLILYAVLYVADAKEISAIEENHQALLERGIKSMQNSEYDKALGLFDSVISQRAQSSRFLSDAYHLKGIAHHFQGPLALDRLRSNSPTQEEPTPEQMEKFRAHSKLAEDFSSKGH